MTHAHDRGLTLLPPPERLIPSLNSSIGEGGWALWRPLRTNTDRNTGRGPPEWNRQTGSSGGHGGAGSSGGHGGAGSSGGHGRWSSGPWPRSPRPGPHSRNPFYPPKKNSLGYLGGIRSPPGLDTQHSTRHDKTPEPDKQDRTSHRNQKPSWAGLEAEASSGHDEESEALTGSLSNRFHFHDKGGRRLKWPPRPQNKEPPAPDESPWTRHDKIVLKCSCGHNKNTALLAVTCGLDPRG